MRGPILASADPVNPPKLLLDENLSPTIAVTLAGEGVDVVHVRDRGLLHASDAVVFGRALDEDRIFVTSDVDDFTKLARAAAVHAGLVFFEDGGLLRAEQLQLVRQALTLIATEIAAGRDMVNRALRIWFDGSHVLESIPPE
jgi:predicted nuclease of predicted toxin-antitoxin system